MICPTCELLCPQRSGAKGGGGTSGRAKPSKKQYQQQDGGGAGGDSDGDDEALLMNLKDCRDMPLKPQHADRPIWVLPDGHIYLEASSLYYHQVRVPESQFTAVASSSGHQDVHSAVHTAVASLLPLRRGACQVECMQHSLVAPLSCHLVRTVVNEIRILPSPVPQVYPEVHTSISSRYTSK